MASITQDMRYRLSLIRYAEKYGVSKAAVKYKTNRQYIYRWKRRYDGSWDSLRDRSRRPHHHPNQHTSDEWKLISDMRRRNPDAGLVIFWVKLRQRGYSRSITGLYRFLRKQGIMAVHPLTPNISLNPMRRWTIRDSASRWTSNLFPPPASKTARSSESSFSSTLPLMSIPDGVL